jgi:hypothetical protein
MNITLLRRNISMYLLRVLKVSWFLLQFWLILQTIEILFKLIRFELYNPLKNESLLIKDPFYIGEGISVYSS